MKKHHYKEPGQKNSETEFIEKFGNFYELSPDIYNLDRFSALKTF